MRETPWEYKDLETQGNVAREVRAGEQKREGHGTLERVKREASCGGPQGGGVNRTEGAGGTAAGEEGGVGADSGTPTPALHSCPSATSLTSRNSHNPPLARACCSQGKERLLLLLFYHP